MTIWLGVGGSRESHRELRLVISDWRNWVWQMQEATQRSKAEGIRAEAKKSKGAPRKGGCNADSVFQAEPWFR